MLLSRNWLREFVDIDADARMFAEEMTLSGSKVESITDLGAEISAVVVGEILEIKRHENSDHMWICQVDTDEDKPLQIVTGAQNVKVGDLVPVAKDGSILPGGLSIQSGELRGVSSEGMLCSLKELGLDTHDFPGAAEDGIFLLNEENCIPGTDIRSIIGADDTVFEFEITPNRPDCLSIIGLAREAAATFEQTLTLHAPLVKGGGPGSLPELLDVEVPATDLCPRYTARMVRNVKIAPSPKWMRERLRASGVRPINNIVDITNYVMLEYGQPMHAFDYRYVSGGKIIVRRAEEGETLSTLDGTLRTLTGAALVIADETRAVGLAGIMGGENSEIAEDTVDVVFESANFDGTCIRKTALSLGMRTEASAKFEKGLDIYNTLPAVNRACELVELLGAGEVLDGVIDVLNYAPNPTVLDLQPERINALLGTDIAPARMIAILKSLGFSAEGERITVPSFRADVAHYSDLAEEVARFFGYNNIPVTAMRGETTQGGFSPEELLERKLGALCRAMGHSEIITYSFISPSYYDKIRLPADSPLRKSITIMNPLGEDTSIMRTTILPSMLEILSRNYNYRNQSVQLYELGRCYFAREDGLADEPKTLCLGAYGDEMDFFALKGKIEAILSALRIEELSFRPLSDHPSYHPGRCAAVEAGGQTLGVLGQIHPLVASHYDVDTKLYCAELSFEALFRLQGDTPVYTPLPRFPSVHRDIALLVQREISVGTLEACIRGAAGGLLREVALFDIYTGDKLPAEKKSVAFSLVLRSDERSLTAQDAEEEIQAILSALKRDYGVSLR